MSHTIRDILDRIQAIESRTTPVSVKQGLNAQQREVPQLPALFRAKKIKALGSDTDPQHPMKDYAVGANESLAEAMAEIEEDMLSKVKRDLTMYLDRLEKKQKIAPYLRNKALDAIEKRKAEEKMKEDPTAQDPVVTPPPAPMQNPTLPESKPLASVTMEDGQVLEIHGDETQGFEIRNRGRSLGTRFPKLDHAQMAIDLFRSRRQPQTLSQDYIEER